MEVVIEVAGYPAVSRNLLLHPSGDKLEHLDALLVDGECNEVFTEHRSKYK